MTSLRIGADTSRSPVRPTRHGNTAVPFTRPERLRAIPLNVLAEAFARWNYRQDRAKDEYYRRPLEKR